MQDHRYRFEVDATPEKVWSVYWDKKTGNRETYHVFDPVMRFFLEEIVHRAISKDNDKKMKQGIAGGLRALRRLQFHPP